MSTIRSNQPDRRYKRVRMHDLNERHSSNALHGFLHYMVHLGSEREHVCAVERRREGDHLIEDAARGPNVYLLSVRLVLHDLWTDTQKTKLLNTSNSNTCSPGCMWEWQSTHQQYSIVPTTDVSLLFSCFCFARPKSAGKRFAWLLCTQCEALCLNPPTYTICIHLYNALDR